MCIRDRFQAHHLPTPGAAGIYCASAGAFGGDASYIAYPLGEARIPAANPSNPTPLGYLSATDPKDPLVAPLNSPDILAKFPPTLLITATRDFAMSGALNTNIALTKAGVDSEDVYKRQVQVLGSAQYPERRSWPYELLNQRRLWW